MILRILLHKPNSYSVKAVIKQDITVLYPAECAKMIREGAYNENYDVNNDGYLDVEDYNTVYERFYLKYRTMDITDLIKIQKAIGTNDLNLDLDNDLTVTENDLLIGRHWLLFGQEPKENLNV